MMITSSRKYINAWTSDEDNLLRKAVAHNLPQAWTDVAVSLPGRNGSQCKQRYEFALAPGLKKGYWSEAEDAILLQAVQELGKNFVVIAQRIPGRSVKQIRERYTRQLDPTIKRGKFSAEEDALLLTHYKTMGGCWSKIARMMEGRTASSIKNRCNTLLGKRSSGDTSNMRKSRVCKRRRPQPRSSRTSIDCSAVLTMLNNIDSMDNRHPYSAQPLRKSEFDLICKDDVDAGTEEDDMQQLLRLSLRIADLERGSFNAKDKALDMNRASDACLRLSLLDADEIAAFDRDDSFLSSRLSFLRLSYLET